MSSSGTCALGGIGIGPHTPEPPPLTFCVSLASADESPLYLAATSINAGPTIFLSTPWQAEQPSLAINASPALRSSGVPALAGAEADVVVAVAPAEGVAVDGADATAGALAVAPAETVAAGAAGSLKFAPD